MDADSLKVLLIEDNPGDTRLMRGMLADAEGALIDVEWTDRLATGVERLVAGGIDLVLLDLSLPDSQGLDTFLRMRTEVPDVPIVVLTGLDDTRLAVTAVQKGAQDYLIKGQVDSPLLVRAIRYAIERHRMQGALRGLSLLDDLTGLYNRRGLLGLAGHHLKLAQRMHRGVQVVFADLDGLKQINDTFGHQEGDRALIKASEILRETYRQSDIIARIGGDEFVVLAITNSHDIPQDLTARLRQKLEDYNARNPGR
jgi:two-component system cell cycle response regulator